MCKFKFKFEWIPYNQFGNIEEIGKGGFATVYSAIWKDGPLGYIRVKTNIQEARIKRLL